MKGLSKIFVIFNYPFTFKSEAHKKHLKGVCKSCVKVGTLHGGEGMEQVFGHFLPFCQDVWTCVLG